MQTIRTTLLAASALMAASVGAAHAQNKNVVNANQPGQTQPFTGDTQSNLSQSRTLFTIGSGAVGVHLWSQVAPPYDTHADRNFNADPLWEASPGTSESSAW